MLTNLVSKSVTIVFILFSRDPEKSKSEKKLKKEKKILKKNRKK